MSLKKLIIVTSLVFHLSIIPYIRCETDCGKPIRTNPNTPDCSFGNQMIVNGIKADPYSWPWQANLALANEGNRYYCGASIISDSFILTAGHCVRQDDESSGEVVVVVGTNTRKFNESYGIKKVTIHPMYQRKPVAYDIAIIELASKLKWCENVLPICLAQKEPEPGRGLFTVGFGSKKVLTSKKKGVFSENLEEICLRYVPQSVCKSLPSLKTPNSKDTLRFMPNMFCGINPTRLGSGCGGDSGGPLMGKDDDGKWVQYGIASWADCRSITVYTDVRKYMGWINSVIL